MQRLLSGFLLSLLGPLASASDTIQILPGDNLQAAIDAAQPGDVIEFLEPLNALPETLVITKGITLLGTNLPGASAMFLVRDVPAGQTVVLQKFIRGAVANAQFESPGGGPILRVEDCAGAVFVNGCFLAGRFGQNGVEVENASVVLSRSTFLAGDLVSGSDLPAAQAGYGATVLNGRLYLDNALIRGGAGASIPSEGPLPLQMPGAEAVVLQDSSLAATRSTLQGGRGASGGNFETPTGPLCLPGLPGRAAILGLGQSVAQIDGGDSLAAGLNGAEDCGNLLPPAPEIQGFTQPGASIETSNALYSAGAGNTSFSGAFHPGDGGGFTTFGLPGELVFYSTASSILPPPEGAPGFGLWLGDLPNPVRFLGVIPEDYGLTLDFIAPDLPPGSTALQAWFQSGLVDPVTGAVRLLTPATVVVVP